VWGKLFSSTRLRFSTLVLLHERLRSGKAAANMRTGSFLFKIIKLDDLGLRLGMITAGVPQSRAVETTLYDQTTSSGMVSPA
ncbi:MAG TPA: hypothetical protein VF074_01145, partial [Pyrinomonadaceae bacterium]